MNLNYESNFYNFICNLFIIFNFKHIKCYFEIDEVHPE